jgi:hypothetical protein
MKELSSCVGCLIGSLPGAFFSFLICGLIYKMIFPGPVTNGYECARGNFYAYLSILVGCLLVGYIAYKADDKVEQTKGSRSDE